MSTRAYYTGANDIVAAFESLRPTTNPWFSIWAGNDLLCQYNGDDRDKAETMLREMMNDFEENENTDLLYIKFHPGLENGYITNRSKHISKIPVRAFDPNKGGDNAVSGITRPGDMPRAAYNMLQRIEANTSMEARLKALEDIKPDAKEIDWFERISGLLDKPGVADMISGIVGPVIQKLMPGMPPMANIALNGKLPTPPIAQTTGITGSSIAQSSDDGIGDIHFTDAENDILDKAILDLNTHCNIVEVLPKLADYAATNKTMFDMLLGMLVKKTA